MAASKETSTNYIDVAFPSPLSTCTSLHLPTVPEEPDHLALIVELCNDNGMEQGGPVAYGAPPVMAPKPPSLISSPDILGNELYVFPFMIQVAEHL